MVAVARIQPAVVNSPDNRNICGAQIFKEYLIIKEIAVNVVDMNNVRLKFLDFPDEPLSRDNRGQSMPVCQACPYSVQSNAELSSHRNKLRPARHDPISSAAICDIAVPTICHGQLADLLHDASRRCTGPYNRINLQQFLHTFVISSEAEKSPRTDSPKVP